MAEGEAREFKWGMTVERKVLLVLYLFSFVVFILAGVVILSKGKWYGIIWLVAGPIWVLGVVVLVCYTRMPYVRVTPDEITVFRSMVARPQFCRWRDLEGMNEIDAKKVELVPKSGEKITIHLTAIARHEREELLTLLRQHVGGN